MSKTLVFTITTGRSGTVFLTELLARNVSNARVYHEHQQWWSHGVDTPDHSDMMHFNNAGVTRKIRTFWARKFERVLAEPGEVYVEPSHYLAKAGLVENLDLLPSDVGVKIVFLKRDIRKTGLSLFNLREFENPASAWVWLPPASQNCIIPSKKFRQFGRAGTILWYVSEMRARGGYYREYIANNHSCDFVDINLEDFRDEDGAQRFLERLGVPTKPEGITLPPPRNGRDSVSTTEQERQYYEEVYRRISGDPETVGKQFFEAGRTLTTGPVPAPKVDSLVIPDSMAATQRPSASRDEDKSGQVSAPATQSGAVRSPDDVRPIVVLGSWSSGTTAVTGYLARLGAYSCPPHVQTKDPRTPNSHEPTGLRDAVLSRVDQFSLKAKEGDTSGFREWLHEWLQEQKRYAAEAGCSHLIMKHPVSAFFIADLQAVCEPTFLVVTRPFEAIERSRQRRGWHPVYGQAGAKVIYQTIFGKVVNQDINALSVSFDRFRADPTLGGRLHTWVGMDPSAHTVDAALAWVRGEP
ncbi:hypothetical protein SAMN05216241_1065 [Limimonas halophila]|uniref:Sulfotransferase family protein n=1 Tax=Limimonas halophila TaxID=1082479 RepID=A0A1G7RUW8_9PROT|nr:hypothetical protein [Limimonas halophila]SDG14541.1 hypothetical protein SAMN05216241_1065 [Limimonas halophila]